MNEELREIANRLLAAAPASVEMPAGAGKTHTLSATVSVAVENGNRCLVLTHTNAGVDAIRKRLRKFGVVKAGYRVETITSWAFALVRSYPGLAGVIVEDDPDWAKSAAYVGGATKALEAKAIRSMLIASFDVILVDEYQDCTVDHHLFILNLMNAVDKVVVFGDRLQAIFGFAGDLVDWTTHVEQTFPAFGIDVVPQRWLGYNEPLGFWLLGLRSTLIHGGEFDMRAHAVPSLTYVEQDDDQALLAVAHSFVDFSETVVLLDKWAPTVARHASRLGGKYSVMEDVSGNFMLAHLRGSPRDGISALPAEGDPRLAHWFARFAKDCTIGLASVDSTVLGHLGRGTAIGHLSRPAVVSVMDGLSRLQANPQYEVLLELAKEIQDDPTIKLYRWEAWRDVLLSIEGSIENQDSPLLNFRRIRERLRKRGRGAHSRIASRTLLVKGLEYDHVIIADLSMFSDPRNLYVALSRARKSITIVGLSPKIALWNET